jgi:flagellin
MGSFSVLNNIAGLNAQNQLVANNVNLSRTFARLSSGKRLNSGADDAAGLQIADSLRANIRAIDQAVRNANDGISVAQIADGALQEISNILVRAVTLAEEAATETVDSTGRASLQAEVTEIEAEIARIATQTTFNGVNLFTASGLGGALNIFVGDTTGSSSIAVTLNSITVTAGHVTSLGGSNDDLSSVNLTSRDGAASSLSVLRNCLVVVAANRAGLGAGINRLQNAVAVLQSQAYNSRAAESTIRDANMAEEIANLTRYQILTQTGLSALTQANANSQVVLQLFNG